MAGLGMEVLGVKVLGKGQGGVERVEVVSVWKDFKEL